MQPYLIDQLGEPVECRRATLFSTLSCDRCKSGVLPESKVASEAKVFTRKQPNGPPHLQGNILGMMDVATLNKISSLTLPADSYIYKILPVNSDIAAISSDDSLRIINSTSLQDITSGILNNVHAGVTCLEAAHNEKSILLTAGRDAVVRTWDLRLGKSTLDFSDGKSYAIDHACTLTDRERQQGAIFIIMQLRP